MILIKTSSRGGLPARGRHSESGLALALVLIMTTVMLVLLTSVMMMTSTRTQITMGSIAARQADAAANAALETAVSMMVQDLHSSGIPGVSNNVSALAYSSPVIGLVTTQVAGVVNLTLGMSNLASTNAGDLTVSIVSQAAITGLLTRTSRASMDLRLLDVPVTGFIYCYDVDLEHYPWHNWTVSGPVYCSGTAYFYASSGVDLTFADPVFSAGGILHEKTSGSTSAGTIVYLSERNARAPSLVQPPAPAGEVNRMHWILEIPPVADYGTPTGNQRFFNKADVVVVLDDSGVSVATGPKHGGTVVSASLPSTPTNVLTSDLSFYEGRESGLVKGVELDASLLDAWMGEVFGFGSRPSHPVVFVADNRSPIGAEVMNVVRLKNGARLDLNGPANGFTLATPNPLYVRGNFNTVSPKPVLLAGDAFTVLSDNWDDSVSGLSAAQSTTVRAAVITGIVMKDPVSGAPVETGWSANVIRLLENWSLRQLTFQGSLAVLHESETAVSPWGTAVYYWAPTRVFQFTNFFSTFTSTDLPTLRMAVRSNYQLSTPQ